MSISVGELPIKYSQVRFCGGDIPGRDIVLVANGTKAWNLSLNAEISYLVLTNTEAAMNANDDGPFAINGISKSNDLGIQVTFELWRNEDLFQIACLAER